MNKEGMKDMAAIAAAFCLVLAIEVPSWFVRRFTGECDCWCESCANR